SLYRRPCAPSLGKVISLIGHFDLDLNRALGIILDVLLVNVATHYTFFLALLSFSPRTGLYRRPTMSTTSRMIVNLVTKVLGDKNLDEVLQIAEANAGNQSTPPLENDSGRVSSTSPGAWFSILPFSEAHEPPPRNLYLTAAILTREGFITLEDLYPHVSVERHLVSCSTLGVTGSDSTIHQDPFPEVLNAQDQLLTPSVKSTLHLFILTDPNNLPHLQILPL
ncbi:hypothetical protein EDD22DRAFT_986593, partial [Suillus occidentalis]